MEDLDKTLDIMERDKCTALLAENSVRLKKNNIKFTTTDQKHSEAHLDAQYVSYERLIRTLIRQLINIEKKPWISPNVKYKNREWVEYLIN